MRIEDLDTPMPIVDLDIVERNLRRAAEYFAENRIALRPHIKTHKIPEFARRQIALGASGVTCQKLGEAEVMAEEGVDDILLSFPIWGRDKLARLEALARRVKMSAVTDSLDVAQGLASVGARLGTPLDVWVECDVGGERCGVQSPGAAVELAKLTHGLQGARFAGLMTYPPAGRIGGVRAWFEEAFDGLSKAGLGGRIASIGGTPEMYRSHEYPFAHEHRPGTYIYNDRMMMRAGVATLADCALTIAATVVSRPNADRAILDCGSKTLSSDLGGFSDYGLILEYPEARIVRLSEEHGHVDLSGSAAKPNIGERVTVIPNHVCVVTNLFDRVAAAANGRVERMLAIAARGRVR